MFAFRKLRFIRCQNQRQVRELRHRRAQRLINQNLLMRVRQVILAPNDMSDAHFNVVEHDRKVIERMTIRTKQHQIFDL